MGREPNGDRLGEVALSSASLMAVAHRIAMGLPTEDRLAVEPIRPPVLSVVVAGLDPATQTYLDKQEKARRRARLDCRVTPGNDRPEEAAAWGASRTVTGWGKSR